MTTVLPFTKAQCITRLEELHPMEETAPIKEEMRGRRWTEEEHQHLLEYIQRHTNPMGVVNWNDV